MQHFCFISGFKHTKVVFILDFKHAKFLFCFEFQTCKISFLFWISNAQSWFLFWISNMQKSPEVWDVLLWWSFFHPYAYTGSLGLVLCRVTLVSVLWDSVLWIGTGVLNSAAAVHRSVQTGWSFCCCVQANEVLQNLVYWAVSGQKVEVFQRSGHVWRV